MGTYTKILNDIYSVISSIYTGIKFYPANYQGDIDTTNSFCRISILPGKSKNVAHSLTKQQIGLLIISIYVKSDKGDKEIARVSDILNTLFENKTLSNGTQFETSFLEIQGIDPVDSSLYRADYKITFNLMENI